MDWERIDWKALERLRGAFLDDTAGVQDYWRSERDLESYDQTFGQRIRWKWDYVLKELKGRGWLPPRGEVVDWGCGSGVDSRLSGTFRIRFGIAIRILGSIAVGYALCRAHCA